MRISDQPCIVTASNGAVRFECGGATAILDPAAAERAGAHLIERAATGDAREFADRAGKLLIARAADASRQQVSIAA